MDKKIQFSANVMLIDAFFLNFVVADMKKYFEQALNKKLQQIDLSALITFLAFEAGVGEGENETQVLFVYDEESSELFHTIPSDLKKELDGVAFKNGFGEFLLAGVASEEMVDRSDLFLDLLDMVAGAEEVKRMIVLSFNEVYGDEVTKVLNDAEGKAIIQFRMDEPAEPVKFRWEMLAYPVMQAMKIKADEL